MHKTQVEVREEIAARLKKAREDAGFSSTKDFCDKYGLAEAEYLRYENGKKPLKASVAMEYCKFLRISLHWLMVGEENLKHSRNPLTDSKEAVILKFNLNRRRN